MIVCYFGGYDPNYPRNRNIILGLRKNGVRVLECNSRQKFFSGRYFELLKRYFGLKIRPDILLVGFAGHSDVPLAWVIGKLFGVKVVFDSFISLYNTQVEDRKYLSSHSWKARGYYYFEKFIGNLSDLILLDTNAHIQYFVKTFGLPKNKFVRVFVGTDEDLFKPRKTVKENNLITVGFHGYYLPLHGVEYIILAAEKLKKENIKFKLIGRGPDKEKCVRLAKDRNIFNIEFLEPIPYQQLPEFITSVDIYLGGPYGGNAKSLMVIPNKVYEALACGKPVIVGENPAMKELLSDQINCWMVKQTDPKALAQAIKYLSKHNKIASEIGLSGRKLFLDKCTTRNIGKDLIGAMHSKLSKNI